MNRLIVCMLSFGAIGGSAAGQQTRIGTASFAWELSADNGATWSSGPLEVGLDQVGVDARLRVSWSSDAGRWFSSARYDVVWRGEGGGLADSITNIARDTSFDEVAQRLAATRFGNEIKIDDERDTVAPGFGNFAVNSFQFQGAFTPPSPANPAQLFTFRVQLDGTAGERTLRGLPLAPSFGNPIDRYVSIYTNEAGAVNLPQVTQLPATLRVIPSPATLAAFVALGLLAPRRRR